MGSVSSEQGAERRAELKKQPLDLELPVVATGARPGDNSAKRELFTETTETVLVFENGCVIQLSAAVTVGQLIFLTNKQSGKEIVTQVLRKRSYKPTSCYVELEFTESAPNFWGVEFPDIDTTLKMNLAEGGEVASVAEAELTEEDTQQTVPPPDAAEMARLRQEVEALKAQLKSMATAPSESKPAAAKIEVMNPNEPSPLQAKAAEAVPAPNTPAEENPSYPIRMQLPKSEGASNRTSEFAADSAAITAAVEEHLLPKPSLDFEQFPGVSEPSPKLFSRGARRGFGGPIGVLIAIVLLLVAAGITTYRFGLLSRVFGGGSTRASNEKSAFPANTGDAKTGSQPVETGTTPAKTEEVAGENHTATNPDAPDTGSESAKSEAGEPAGNEGSPGGSKRTNEKSSKPKVSLDSKNVKRGNVGHGNSPDAATNPADDVVTPPKLVKSIKSLSPPEALTGFTSGNVKLDAIVDETGHVASATVLSGPKALHQRAIDTVKQYIYQPATKNGKPVQAHVPVTIQFWYEP
ncbi:MAG TPA: energy transducer TonB [Candidatus Dormibacteraeota bacterium]|jgi:hypothetical protein|nr:energy transducer TonB [Candidatus Dormibacteraeota bacterium]